MTVDQLVDLVAARLFGLARATADADEGIGQVEVAANEQRPCEHGALPGFSSGVSPGDGDELLVLRRRAGALSLVSLAHPPGEQAGDRTIWTRDGLTLRLRGKVLEVVGSDAFEGIKLDGNVAVARDGDDCNRNAAMVTWMSQVEAICNALVPGGVTPLVAPTIAAVAASTTRVKAG